jgi:6,7-dimethyl-8-ribityllumazine synthase
MREINATAEGSNHSFPIAVIVSTFNESITTALKQGTIERLNELGFRPKDITVV